MGPSADHLLGTDELGRDVLSRILYGARLSLVASTLAVGVALLIGFPLGPARGLPGRPAGERHACGSPTALMALPGLIVILALISVFGNSTVKAMIALGFVLAPTFLRLTRGVAQSIRSEPYIEATEGARPAQHARSLRRHVLPHVAPSLVVHTSLMLGVALLVEAGLSYIGLGVQPPHASWGAMLTKAAASIRRQPFVIFPPGLAITLTVLALNVLGDGVRDAVGRVDPAPRRSRRRATDVRGRDPGPRPRPVRRRRSRSPTSPSSFPVNGRMHTGGRRGEPADRTRRGGRPRR